MNCPSDPNPITVAEAVANPTAFLDGFVETRAIVTVRRAASRTYCGKREQDGLSVIVTENCGGSNVMIYPLSSDSPLVQQVSPNGFNWGFRGVAANKLALAILLDSTCYIRIATNHYEAFAREFVSKWGDIWTIDSLAILRWLVARGAFLSANDKEVPNG